MTAIETNAPTQAFLSLVGLTVDEFNELSEEEREKIINLDEDLTSRDFTESIGNIRPSRRYRKISKRKRKMRDDDDF